MDPKDHYESAKMALNFGMVEEANRLVCVLQTNKFLTGKNHFSQTRMEKDVSSTQNSDDLIDDAKAKIFVLERDLFMTT